MYFAVTTILDSIDALKEINPFFGITYLACKEKKLPIGTTTKLSMDNLTKDFMEKNHKLRTDSNYYFQPYSSNSRDKQWVAPRYPSTGLQAINTQTFSPAFIHSKKDRTWGWSENYIGILKDRLEGNLLPALDMAIWFFKKKEWPDGITAQDVTANFFKYFNITGDEQSALFQIENGLIEPTLLFQDTPINWKDFSPYLPAPPDAEPGRGAILSYLELKNIGPASQLSIEPNKRLNLITGDNGLGKTFLMDCSWWALTGTWSEKEAYPNKLIASISYQLKSVEGQSLGEKVVYDIKNNCWKRQAEPSVVPGLVLYARVDDTYAVWDPIKQDQEKSSSMQNIFTRTDIWEGVSHNIEGLLRDWVKWQNTPKKYPFDVLKNVLKEMSPPDLGILQPGKIIRMRNTSLEIPTIHHAYDDIPVIHASAGVKRIITLAYLIVWLWYEHKNAAELYHASPEKSIVILIDEIEEHLHPKWQRVILPSLLQIGKTLSEELEIQFIISTHSPLILASTETYFNKQTDALFHLKMETSSGQVSLSEIEFIRRGTINSWLTSPVFNLEHARSKDGEIAIKKAKELQLQNNPAKEQVNIAHKDLLAALASDDPFWPRWIYFAQKNGVEI